MNKLLHLENRRAILKERTTDCGRIIKKLDRKIRKLKAEQNGSL